MNITHLIAQLDTPSLVHTAGSIAAALATLWITSAISQPTTKGQSRSKRLINRALVTKLILVAAYFGGLDRSRNLSSHRDGDAVFMVGIVDEAEHDAATGRSAVTLRDLSGTTTVVFDEGTPPDEGSVVLVRGTSQRLPSTDTVFVQGQWRLSAAL